MTLRTLLLTDLVDSTQLTETLGDARAAKLWAEHDRRARELIASHDGREIDHTDGFLLMFEHAGDAARFALAYNRSLAELDLSARTSLHVGRIGLRESSPGDVAQGAKRTEVEGLAKPVAARVMSLARPGQTLLTRTAREALGEALPDGTQIESHGHYRLKGILEPLEVFELGVRGSSPFAPPLDAEKAYRVVRAGDLWRPVREVRHNLPAERDAFVGRIADLRSLAEQLDAGTRLLTVLGPGGTGKTRFVRRYAWTWLGDWPGGAYFCDLSEARSFDGVLGAVAVALAVPLGKEDPVVQLGHAIAGRGRCLVILDNFEQVLAHAPATLGRWLDRAADATFVVTSRERLHLPGEALFPLEPLPVEREAIDLFAARARAQRPDFVLGEGNRAAVAEVVRLLDGLPLAIELAAARVRVLSPAQLVERMRDRFALLAGAHGATARQDTLRTAIDWSWDLLTRWEQAALAQCSIFEGGFTLGAAEAVLDLSAWPEAPLAMEAVQALADKSLLRTWVPSDQRRYDIEEPYFGMYLSIHEYAAEKLSARGREVEAAAAQRHGRYFAGFGTDEAIEALFQHGGVKRYRALALELDNLVAACRRAVARGDGDTAVAAYRAAWEVLDLQGPYAVGAALGAQVLALDSLDSVDASLRVAALATRAVASWRAGRTEEARTWLEQALTLSRDTGDRRREGSVRGQLGSMCREQGRPEQAREHLEAAVALSRDVGDRRTEGTMLGSLGNLHLEQGRIEEARVHYEASLAIARGVGNRSAEGMLLGNLGNLHHEQGRINEARTCYEANLAIAREVGNRRSEAVALGNLGNQNGDPEESRAQCEAALAIARELGHRRHEGYLHGSLGNLHSELGRIESALAHYDEALAIYREVGDRRFEGITLRFLADLLVRQGRIDAAKERLSEAEALLTMVGNPLELTKALCIRGRVEVACGRLDLARAALAEAEATAASVGAEPDSELSHAIAELREALAKSST